MQPSQNSPVVEALESRELLAGSPLPTVFFRSDGSLRIIGTNKRDGILIDQVGENLRLQTGNLWATPSNQELTTRLQVLVEDVVSIDMNGGLGGDYLWIDASVSIPTILKGNGDDDNLRGGSGADTIFGNSADDRCFGNDGDDSVSGDAGVDFVRGGEGNDTLVGGTNADELRGDAGNDLLDSKDGKLTDLLIGGSGNDTADSDPGIKSDFDKADYHENKPDDPSVEIWL